MAPSWTGRLRVSVSSWAFGRCGRSLSRNAGRIRPESVPGFDRISHVHLLELTEGIPLCHAALTPAPHGTRVAMIVHLIDDWLYF